MHATEWHIKSNEGKACSVCGCRAKAPGEHRRMPGSAPPRFERRTKSAGGWVFTVLYDEPETKRRPKRPVRFDPLNQSLSLFHRQVFEPCENSLAVYFGQKMAPRYASQVSVREFERAVAYLRQWQNRDVAVTEVDDRLLSGFRRWLDSQAVQKGPAAKMVAKIRFIVADWRRRQRPAAVFRPEAAELAEPGFPDGIPNLQDVFGKYVLYHTLSSGAEYQLRHSVELFGEFLGREPTVLDLTDETVSAWVQSLEESLSKRTVAGQRANLISLWKLAHDEYMVRLPVRVRKVRKPDPMPVAWTMDELKAILAQCESLEGCFSWSGVPKALYCSTLVRFCYETGLRRADVRLVTLDQIRPDGTIFLRQHKTDRRHAPRIRIETRNGLIRLQRDPPLANPFAGEKAWYRFWRREVIEPAGVRHGSMHQLRRTGATHVARTYGIDAARRFLGHRTPTMVNHYVDESISMPEIPMPPALQS